MTENQGHGEAAPGSGVPERDLESRLEQARLYFRRHHANVQPDPAFADRVTARLRREPVELLGWAALRLLPATLALLLILAWISFQADGSNGVQVADAGSGDLIGWVLEETEGSP